MLLPVCVSSKIYGVLGVRFDPLVGCKVSERMISIDGAAVAEKIQSRNFCKSIKPGQLPDICHGCHRKVSRALWPEWWVVTSVKLVNLGGYSTTRNHLPPIRNSLERLKNVRMLWDFGILKVSLDPRKVCSYAQNISIHFMVSLL